jgi:UDP:flavonoid glycosyltransferase YjiC (YdhE family)
VAAVIHHGGAGTTQTVARAGVPQLVVPHGADQFYWAHRVHTLGLGPRPFPKTKFSQTRLVEGLAELKKDASYARRAAELGERVRHVDGVGNAVRYLEEKHTQASLKSA